MGECCDSNKHEYQKGCGCGCGCGEHHHHHGHHGEEGGCHCTDKLLEIADDAWRELLKEKIKAKILTKKGEHMEKLAEIIAVANGAKWKHKMAAKAKNEEFKESLKEYFTQCEEH